MSQGFKLRYDELREGDPSKPENNKEELEAGQIYRGPGHARSLCLIWPDNTRMFFNYAYLISGTFTIGEERNMIRLNFSGHTVQLGGYALELLFMQLLEHTTRIVIATEERYLMDMPANEVLVTEISVEINK